MDNSPKDYLIKDSSNNNISLGGTSHIRKMFMPPNSTDRFLTAPVRAVRSSRRHSHSASYQEPIRRSLGPPGPPGPSGPSVPSGPSG